MHIYRTFRQSCGVRDFEDIQVLQKPEKENSALSLRESFRRFPNGLNLFVHRSPLLWGDTSIRPIMNLSTVHPLRFFPELKAPVLYVIAHQVDRNSHQPRMHAAVPAKQSSASVSIPETILCQRFGQIYVTYRGEQESQHSRPVQLDDTVKVLELQGRVLHIRRDEPGRCACFHAFL